MEQMISEQVPGRNHTQCLQRWGKVLAPGLKKVRNSRIAVHLRTYVVIDSYASFRARQGHWTQQEDAHLMSLVGELAQGGTVKNWASVADRVPGRTSKQCRERWFNHLDPNIKRGNYTAEEDEIIMTQQAKIGNRW